MYLFHQASLRGNQCVGQVVNVEISLTILVEVGNVCSASVICRHRPSQHICFVHHRCVPLQLGLVTAQESALESLGALG